MFRPAKLLLGLLAALLPLVCLSPAVLGENTNPHTPEPLQILSGDLQMKLLAQAQPDECFAGIGIGGQGVPPCGPGSVPKVNQAYIWGMTYASGRIWFGTVANTECLVMSAVLGTNPIQTSTWVCEYAQSQFAQSHPEIPAAYGDWRPPQIFAYDPATGNLSDKTAAAGTLIGDTTGLRSAGTLNDVVLLAGPGLTGGVSFFAFRASDGAFLGATKIAAYNDIRRWVEVDGVLYCGVGVTGGGGAVLRWIGDAANPMQFQVVGSFSDPAWDLTVHQGRLFVVTWPVMNQPNPSSNIAALIMGPSIPPGGLTPAQANPSLWVKVWKADNYEPDALTARSYGAGALKSFGGYLYWGTMHIPLAAATAATKLYVGLDYANAIPGTGRAIALFRGKDFATAQQTLEILYGEQYLPVYESAKNSYTTGNDGLHQNKMPNPVPTWGHSGFGCPFNTYTWSMEIYNNKLYVGTFDFTYLMDQFANGEILIGIPPAVIADFLATLPIPQEGADLYRFDSSGRASLVSNDGIGNYLTYGVRNMLTSRDTLYLGMANPMNLATDPGGPNGGWKLLQLTAKSSSAMLSLLLED
jgi:hypothetical protein